MYLKFNENDIVEKEEIAKVIKYLMEEGLYEVTRKVVWA